jgi:hypothetical protein
VQMLHCTPSGYATEGNNSGTNKFLTSYMNDFTIWHVDKYYII